MAFDGNAFVDEMKNNNGYSCQAISPFANKQFQYTITSKGLTDQS